MGKNNMTGGNSMKQSSFRCLVMLLFVFQLNVSGWAQDRIPGQAIADVPLSYPKQAPEYRLSSQPLTVYNPMPSSFKNVSDNVLADANHSLTPFFEKLRTMRTPVRIVHIGDSHIRGHVLSSQVRTNFERDFGHEATLPDTITYWSSGLAKETGLPGVVYHCIGINGATCLNFTNPMQAQEIASLKPDLIIVSFGTNESHGRGYSVSEHDRQIDNLINLLKEYCPNTAFLLTTPPGSYLRYRRKRSINPRTEQAAKTITDYAKRNNLAYWNMYNIVGGRKSACLNWTNNNLMQRDRIHYTADGYHLQGNLLYEAFIKAYNDYVAN